MSCVKLRGVGIGVFVWVLSVIATTIVHAEGPAATGPSLSGFVDTSYIYSFKQPKSGTIFSRSFDAQDNNIANTAQVQLTGTLSDVGYVIKLLAGNDAKPISLAEGTQSSFDLEEAYATYKFPSSSFGLKIGKMVTYEGIEVVESVSNPNISKGYLFNLAEPTTHTGGVVTYTNGKWDAALGGVNGWDVHPDNNTGKTAIGKISFNLGDPLFVQLSGISGPEQARVFDDPTTPLVDESDSKNGNTRNSLDLTGVTKIIPNLALNFQGNWGQEKRAFLNPNSGLMDLATWKGCGIQPVYTFTKKFSVGARVEYFWDPQGVRTGTGATEVALTNYTITPAYKLADNFIFRTEYRYDKSNKKVWQDDKGVAKKDSSTISAEFIVTF